MVGVDVGFENPTFACLELDYEEADQDSTGEAVKQAQQTLTYYELDLGMTMDEGLKVDQRFLSLRGT